MATNDQKYMLGWNGHADNFSISFSDLLEQKELIDVMLVADGHLFNAHRLVLSALSPYFRQMFTQMPANQQAFVFMKDVSKHTLDDLITFIYRGEVNVRQGDLNEFFDTAKALQIKGLTDETYSNSIDFSAPTSTWLEPGLNGFQYQSSRTMQVQHFVNSDPTSSHYYRQSSNDCQQQDNFDFEKTDEKPEIGYKMADDYDDNACSYGMGDDDPSMEQTFDVQGDQWGSNYHDSGADEKQTNAIASKAKRVKRTNDAADYEIVADIRKNTHGRENLVHNNYIFNKNGQGKMKQSWQCNKKISAQCKASASTMEIDGVVMMKVLNAEHSHKPDQ